MKLLEYLTMLVEDRRDFIKKQWGDKIAARISHDSSGRFYPLFQPKWEKLRDNAENPPDAAAYEQLAVETALEILARAGEKHLQWVTKQWLAGQFKLEDMGQIREDLARFDRLKRQLPQEQRDLNRLPNLNALYDILEPHENADTESQRAKGKAITQKFFDDGDAVVIYEKDGIKIVRPKTKEASCHLGKGTKWCTAATQSENYFMDYDENGGIYIIYAEGKRYQLGLEEGDNEPYWPDQGEKPEFYCERIQTYMNRTISVDRDEDPNAWEREANQLKLAKTVATCECGQHQLSNGERPEYLQCAEWNDNVNDWNAQPEIIVMNERDIPAKINHIKGIKPALSALNTYIKKVSPYNGTNIDDAFDDAGL